MGKFNNWKTWVIGYIICMGFASYQVYSFSTSIKNESLKRTIKRNPALTISSSDFDQINSRLVKSGSPVVEYSDAIDGFLVFTGSSVASTNSDYSISLNFEGFNESCPLGYSEISSGFRSVSAELSSNICIKGSKFTQVTAVSTSPWEISPDISNIAEYAGDSSVFKVANDYLKLGVVSYCYIPDQASDTSTDSTECKGISVIQLSPAMSTSLSFKLDGTTYSASFSE